MKCLLASLSIVVALVMATNIGGVDGQRNAACPTFCTYEYQPVCGFNGDCYRTFPNQCSFNGEKCNRQPNLVQVDLATCQGAGSKQC